MFGVYCSSGSSSGGSSNGVVAVEPLSLSLASLLERDLFVLSAFLSTNIIRCLLPTTTAEGVNSSCVVAMNPLSLMDYGLCSQLYSVVTHA